MEGNETLKHQDGSKNHDVSSTVENTANSYYGIGSAYWGSSGNAWDGMPPETLKHQDVPKYCDLSSTVENTANSYYGIGSAYWGSSGNAWNGMPQETLKHQDVPKNDDLSSTVENKANSYHDIGSACWVPPGNAWNGVPQDPFSAVMQSGQQVFAWDYNHKQWVTTNKHTQPAEWDPTWSQCWMPEDQAVNIKHSATGQAPQYYNETAAGGVQQYQPSFDCQVNVHPGKQNTTNLEKHAMETTLQDMETGSATQDFHAKGGLSVGGMTKDGLQPCPLPDCSKPTQRATKHLEYFHKMSPRSAKLVRNLLKAYTRNKQRRMSKIQSKKDGYKECPICGEYVTRVNKHMKMHDKKTESEMDYDDDDDDDDDKKFSLKTQKNETKYVRRCKLPAAEGKKEDDLFLQVEKLEKEEENEDPQKSSSEEDSETDDRNVDKQTRAMLKQYKEWLVSPAGGKLDIVTARPYAKGCLVAIESVGGTMESIQNYRNIGLPGGLMDTMEKDKKKPTTIRNVLLGMGKLMTFLQDYPQTVLTREEANTAISIMKNYRFSLRKDISMRKSQNRRESQIQVGKTLPKMAEYATRDHYKTAKSIFKKANRGGEISPREFYHIKEYIITRLIISNGHRTGVIMNSLMSEYEEATKINDTYVIQIEKHKTGHKGEAHLSVLHELWPELLIYVGMRMERIENGKFLFPTNKGTEMQHSHVGRCLGKALGIKTCPNVIRKATVVLHKETDATQEEMADLATLMAHEEATQRKYYEVNYKDKVAAKASKGIVVRLKQYKEKIDKEETSETDEDEPSEDEPSEDEPSAKKTHTDSVVTETELDGSENNKLEEAAVPLQEIPTNSTSQDNKTYQGPIKIFRGRHAGFTKEHNKLLRDWFPQQTKTKEIESCLETNPGFAEKMKDFSVKQITDKVRSIYKKKK